MIICNANCSIFNRCKDKIPQQVCIYDLGLQEEKEDDLEKMFEEGKKERKIEVKEQSDYQAMLQSFSNPKAIKNTSGIKNNIFFL